MSETITVEDFVEMLEDSGYEARTDYSGRGMRGDTCIGYIVNSETSESEIVADLMINIMESAADLEEAINRGYEFARLLKSAKTDSMGRDTIVYFPRMKTNKKDED